MGISPKDYNIEHNFFVCFLAGIADRGIFAATTPPVRHPSSPEEGSSVTLCVLTKLSFNSCDLLMINCLVNHF